VAQYRPEPEDDEPNPKVLGRLNRLAGLAGETNAGRIRQRVLENLDALTQLCLERERSYVTREGEERSYPDPELKTALSAQLAGARILGVDEGAGAGAVDEAAVSALVKRARRALAAKQAVETQESSKRETH
jgi:hypothetical protein